MQNCPHYSTVMENYATICPGCSAERDTMYSYYFNWLGFLIGLPISLILAVIIELIFDLPSFIALILFIVFVVITFMLAKNNRREHNR